MQLVLPIPCVAPAAEEFPRGVEDNDRVVGSVGYIKVASLIGGHIGRGIKEDFDIGRHLFGQIPAVLRHALRVGTSRPKHAEESDQGQEKPVVGVGLRICYFFFHGTEMW
jgi:hypothetical protein